MNKLLPIFILIIVNSVAFAQEPFHWKTLSFDSAPEEAVRVLGRPRKETNENAGYAKTISAAARQQANFRGLKFEKFEAFDEVFLLYMNGRLVEFRFTPKKKTVAASGLGEIYGADFLFAETLAKGMKFGDYEGQKETTVPKVYPAGYFMLAVKPDYAIVATVENRSWKAIWREGIKKPTLEMFPGHVTMIQVFGRSFEEK